MGSKATLIVITSEDVAFPSVTEKVISGYVPKSAGVHVKTCVVILKLAPGGRLEAEYSRLSPSASVALSCIFSSLFLATIKSPVSDKTGGLLTGYPPPPGGGAPAAATAQSTAPSTSSAAQLGTTPAPQAKLKPELRVVGDLAENE